MKIKRIWILTMFPEYFIPLQECGVLGSALRNERATNAGEFELITVKISDFCAKGFKGVDDAPFGGGQGMIMRPDVMENALLRGVVQAGGYDQQKIKDQLHIVCPLPRGAVWKHQEAIKFATEVLSFECDKDVVFICGRYEGIDERFLEMYVDQYLSLGDYIITGGELAVMIILDAAMRFVPGVVGNKLSVEEESFASGPLEHPLYTRPREFHGMLVPEPYLNGHHKNIEALKKKQSLEMTKKYRPDLLKK